MTRFSWRVWGALFLLLLPARAVWCAEPLVMKSMEQEMQRSMKKLQFEEFKTPYFLAYRLIDARRSSLAARYGAIVQNQNTRNRFLYVELRYGTYDFDNTDQNFQGYFESAALDEDGEALRHRLWLLTDRAYKDSINSYLIKQGKKISEMEKERVADFSRETPQVHAGPLAESEQGLDFYADALRKASLLFRSNKEILDSGLTLNKSRSLNYYLNSEGAKIVSFSEANPYYLYLWAEAQALDGMGVSVARTFSARKTNDLPGDAELKNSVDEMVGDLLRLRNALLSNPYTGPAILDSESTGVLFHEAVGHRLEGERLRDSEEGQTFKGQVGKKIIPGFITVTDNPALDNYLGVSLNGYYPYDDEGVPSQAVVLVEDGVLKNYLMSRRPIQGFAHSNGHGRAQFGRDPIGRMSNLFVKSSKGIADKKLKELLLQECKRQGKPYGLWIRRTRSGDTYTGRAQYQAFRGTPEEVYLIDVKTKQETLVRGVEIVGTPLITINKILAMGTDYQVMNAFCQAESGSIPVSTIAPSVLVKEVELQRVKEDKKRPPILMPPLFANKEE